MRVGCRVEARCQFGLAPVTLLHSAKAGVEAQFEILFFSTLFVGSGNVSGSRSGLTFGLRFGQPGHNETFVVAHVDVVLSNGDSQQSIACSSRSDEESTPTFCRVGTQKKKEQGYALQPDRGVEFEPSPVSATSNDEYGARSSVSSRSAALLQEVREGKSGAVNSWLQQTCLTLTVPFYRWRLAETWQQSGVRKLTNAIGNLRAEFELENEEGAAGFQPLPA